MDDKQFDHIVKNKLESLTPPYKEEAWKALDYKLDLLAPLPWYSRWQSLLVASSLGIITLLNIGLLYKVDNDQEQVKQLLRELSAEAKAGAAIDTVYLNRGAYLGTSFLNYSGENTLAVNHTGTKSSLDFLDPLTIYKIASSAGKNTKVASSQFNKVSESSTEVAATMDFGSVKRPVATISSLDPFEENYHLNAPTSEDMYVRGVVLPPSKKKWDNPLRPRIGVFVGYLIPDPDLGERYVSSRQSLLVETPIRGNFHLLSGISHQQITYKLDDVDDNNFERTTLLKYPGFGKYINSPDEILVENKMLQIPLYFRYYKPLNRSWMVFAGGGPTVDILLNQKFTYSFLEIQDEKLVKFDETQESKDVSVTLGSFSGNMGVEHYFNRRLSAQAELNYQYGLGKIGLEGRSFNSFSVSAGLFYKLNTSKIR